MKHMAKKGKLATKKWVFRAKKRVIGVGKLRAGNQTRKAKWHKNAGNMQKRTEKEMCKAENNANLHAFGLFIR